MKNKPHNQALLNNKYDNYLNEDDLNDYIEMENFQISNNKAKYIKLQEEGTLMHKILGNHFDQRYFTNAPLRNQPQINSEHVFVDKVIVPQSFYYLFRSSYNN